MNLSSTNSSKESHGYVQKNSVQSQFAELTKERTALRNQTQAANRNREMQQKAIQNLRETELSLKEQIRKAQGTLGMETKKRVLLLEEQKTKTNLLQQDRKEIDKLSHQLVDMNKAESERKKAFAKEMSTLNSDIEDSYRQWDETKLGRLVTIPSVKLMLDTLRAVESKIDLKQEERAVLSSNILDSLRLFEEANGKRDKEDDNLGALEDLARELRLQAKQGRGTTTQGRMPLGEPELDELEHLWEQDWNQTAESVLEEKDETLTETADMKLFYGDESQKQEEDMSVDDENIEGNKENEGNANAVM